MAAPAGGRAPTLSDGPLLGVEALEVEIPGAGDRPAVVLRRISFAVDRGEAVGLIGESGAGKSLTALAVLGLLPASARVIGGTIRFDGVDLRASSDREMRAIRGGRIGYMPQEPATAFNPMWSVGFHLREAIRQHGRGPRGAMRSRVEELLRLAGLDEVTRIRRSFPHQLSSGQRQRAFLAVALAGEPDLLIADEPTSALDARIRNEILETLARRRRERRLALLLISHDLSAVAEICDRALVMHAGEIVEEIPVAGVA
ncbi:MAG: ATP-binding cassette domain-containing protein [Thermoanaerobaculia bacterium]